MRAKKPVQPTDDRLLDTAIDQFGRKGLEGASTRAIAAAAGTAMSSITYHYGGKDGLYLAAARHIAAQITARMATRDRPSFDPARLTPDEAREAVLDLLDPFFQIMLSPESAPWARFIVREQMEPTEAFEILYENLFSHVASRLIPLVLRAGGGRWDEATARVRAVSIMGQILIFRVGRAAALRVTGWEDVGPEQAAKVRSVVRANVRAILNPATESAAS